MPIAAQNKPFPQQNSFDGVIKPQRTQDQLNQDVILFYEKWKAEFLKPTNMPGGYYIHGECTGCSEPAKGTSEGHGWGMLITVLMAGHDADAKTYFDGLFLYFDQHRSVNNNELMSWMVENSENGGEASATDGDMDIAYALILAHYQWGSDQGINYLQEAKDMITYGLKVSDMNVSTKRVMLGDWDNNPYSTRSSDWMTAQLRAYGDATGDNFWYEAVDTAYNLVDAISTNYSTATGLMPDFVVGQSPQPAAPYFLEADTDDDYSWNACRFPWRIAMDYGHYQSSKSKAALTKVMDWAVEKTNGDPSAYKAGYTLSGSPLVSYSSHAFLSPLLAASTVDSKYQSFLNAGWNTIKDNYYSYYDASITMLCMLYISGNWWVPTNNDTGDGDDNALPTATITSPDNGFVINVDETVTVNVTANDADGQVEKVTFYQNGVRIGEDSTAPFQYSWVSAQAGDYTIAVRATDNEGAVSTLSSIMITVNDDDTSDNCGTIVSWDNSTIYLNGDLVVYQGAVYEAQWWTLNMRPDQNSGPWEVWQLQGPCTQFKKENNNSAISSAQGLTYYPNPFKDTITIQVAKNLGSDTQINIFDTAGVLVLSKTITAQALKNTAKITLNTATLRAGVYIVKINNNGQQLSRKIIKK